MSKNVTTFIMCLLAVAVVGLFVFYAGGIVADLGDFRSSAILSVDKADNYRDEKYEIYHMSGTDIGSTEVYYDQGTWVMYTDDKLTQVQQYLKAPFDKSIYEIVSAIPAFKESDATYMGYSTDGTLIDVDKNSTFKSVGTEYCFVEWENEGYYYSYTFQKNDVAIYTIYDKAENLFRVYSAEAMKQYEEQATAVTETDVPTSEGAVTEVNAPTATTEVSVATTVAETTTGTDID